MLYPADTRAALGPRHLLLTPDNQVEAPLPGWGDRCVVLVSPAVGARFSQLIVRLGPGATARPMPGPERFVLVRAGTVAARTGGEEEHLKTGGYCYAPPDEEFFLQAGDEETELLVFEKEYETLAGVEPPGAVFGREQKVVAEPFLGDDWAMLKTLLPEEPAFDLAVNVFAFRPGATLPFVEVHVMEHGLLMLDGAGVYRLGDDWYPVGAGDAIWMSPFCPQWFAATGKQEARYAYYKDVNREPLGRRSRS